jgi:hypothetical protein
MESKLARRRPVNNGPSIQPDWTAQFLPGGVVGFVGEHPLLGAAAAPAFLTPDLLDAREFSSDAAFLEPFDLVEQEPASKESVERLLTRGLAFDLQTRGPMQEHDARGSLVDILATVPAAAHERFRDVGLPNAERDHALRQLRFLVGRDGERGHVDSVASAILKSNGAA